MDQITLTETEQVQLRDAMHRIEYFLVRVTDFNFENPYPEGIAKLSIYVSRLKWVFCEADFFLPVPENS